MAQALTPASLAGSLLICTHVRSPSDLRLGDRRHPRINGDRCGDHAQVSTADRAAQESARGRHGDALDRQKGSLDRERPLAAAPRIAAATQAAVARDHAMARHEQPDRLRPTAPPTARAAPG